MSPACANPRSSQIDTGFPCQRRAQTLGVPKLTWASHVNGDCTGLPQASGDSWRSGSRGITYQRNDDGNLTWYTLPPLIRPSPYQAGHQATALTPEVHNRCISKDRGQIQEGSAAVGGAIKDNTYFLASGPCGIDSPCRETPRVLSSARFVERVPKKSKK